VTFWVAHFVTVDCDQQINKFSVTLCQSRGGWRYTFLPHNFRLRRPQVFVSYLISFLFFFFSRSIFSQLWVTLRRRISSLPLSLLAGTLSSSFPNYIFSVCVFSLLGPAKNNDYRLTQQMRGLTDTLPKNICKFPRWRKPKR
jgi:hypothetical protein